MKLSQLMRSAATTDSDEAREVIAEFQEYIERHQLGLIKLGGQRARREVPRLLRQLEVLARILEMTDGEPLEEET